MTTEPMNSPTSINEEPRVSREQAERFYDRVRNRIHNYLARGKTSERIADFLLLVPDVFILLWRLTTDTRVSGQDKVLLGSGIAYFILPLDIMPEAVLGPIGYLDDLVFGVYILNKLIVGSDVQILREHWSGHEDVLDMIRRVLDSADQLVAADWFSKLRGKK